MFYYYTCACCGKECTGGSANAKYCKDCSIKVMQTSAKNNYYRKKGQFDKIVTFEQLKAKAAFNNLESKKARADVCPLEHCEFADKNNKCLFYITYADGTASCPNIKARQRAEAMRLKR